MGSAWRKVVIRENATLRKKDNCMLIEKEGGSHCVSVQQISTVIIESPQVTFSSSLMTYLVENGVTVVFCDDKHNPFYETVPYHRNTSFPHRLIFQMSWSADKKKDVWNRIIQLKIENQALLLERVGSGEYLTLKEMAQNVRYNNPDETEAKAARLYFRCLYGRQFNRRTENDTNAALNYGYSIILSSVNQAVTAHGYNTSIGINHHSSTNPFNLTCDIMEPFRPFVDEIVYTENSAFNFDLRKKLIAVTSKEIIYKDSRMKLETALEYFTLDAIRSIESDCLDMGGIRFAG